MRQPRAGMNTIVESIRRLASTVVMVGMFLTARGFAAEAGRLEAKPADSFFEKFGPKKAPAPGGLLLKTGELTIRSHRYPFCAAGSEDKDDSLRCGMVLAPFNQDLNRLVLIARRGSADRYRVTWGSESRLYSAEQLAKGVNLVADFAPNPFWTAFSRVDEAVATKQAYETRQVQGVFHGNEGRRDMNSAVARTEAERMPLVKAIRAAFVPVTHTLKIDPAAPAPSTQATLELRSLTPPVLLPDGTEFLTWEQRPQFSKTYYVDGQHPAASDQNPGTRERPFATINQAAQVLQPGERVIVAAGVYRERIRPVRGGSGPEAMISYEAAPGAEVVLKGSRVFRETWARVEADAGASVWQARLDPKYFDGYNPFDIDNVTARQFEIMDFAAPLRGKPPCTLPRGLVFQDGRRLRQVVRREDVAGSEGTYWVDRANQALYVCLFGRARPDQATIEITTQETVLAPEQMGLGFIRVKGFIVEQAAGPFPWEQVGAISTTRGHHWIIEDNTVRQVNGVGIDVGVQLHRWPQPKQVGFHIVRRNQVNDCGICGIAGMGPGGREFGLLIEDNVLQGNAFHDVETLYEAAAIKTHCNVRCLIRRNLVVDTVHGSGIWMDWDNRNSRCCQNVIVNTHSMFGGIFVEASQTPNLVDQNIILGTQGHGIYEHDCFGQVFVHNFIAGSAKSAFHLHGKITDRRIAGRQPNYGRHVVRNNLLSENHDPDLFGGDASEVGDNLAEGISAKLDRQTWRLTWSAATPATTVPRLPLMTHDFAGASRAARTAPGPFNELPQRQTSTVLPQPTTRSVLD